MSKENSVEFQPEEHSDVSDQRYLKPKKQSKYISGENYGTWSNEEHLKYIVFIEFHKDKMRSREKRRSAKLYKQMSKFIKTRNSLQCRSHHQKLEDKFLYPNKIISHFKEHADPELYASILSELQRESLSRQAQEQSNNLKLQNTFKEIGTQTDISGPTIEMAPIVIQCEPSLTNAHILNPNATVLQFPMMMQPPIQWCNALQQGFYPIGWPHKP